MTPLQFDRRERAWQARHDDAWRRTLLIVNQVRGALDEEPLELDDLREDASAGEAPSRDEWEEATWQLDKRRAQQG